MITRTWLSLAPDGCLQYYTSATGEVRMLGYPMAPHLADLDYTVCVRSEDGAGSIVVSKYTWSQDDESDSDEEKRDGKKEKRPPSIYMYL